MAPLATVGCVVFIVAALRAERHRSDAERISWMPFCWMFIAGSRFVSSWLNLRAPLGTVEAYAEGSPVDRAVFLALIVWGAAVLSRRRIEWGQLLTANALLATYFLYCLLSLAWSDQPDVLVKRWVKDLGNPITALVLLTERKPLAALTTTVRRLGFILLPLSVLFIRYYPELGRGYSADGGMMYSGAAEEKNTLGSLCMVTGLCGVWRWLLARVAADRYELGTAVMLAWLLYMSNSKTSVVCLIVGTAILVTASRSAFRARPEALMLVTTAAAGIFALTDHLFGVQAHILALLGRDPTLTNRTEVWAIVGSLETDPWVGTGFMSFWSGHRMEEIWTKLGAGINQAHNGYIEQYINLGYVGVVFILLIVARCLLSIRQQLASAEYNTAALRFTLLIVALLQNYTEASFYGVNTIWVLFLVTAIAPPGIGGYRAADSPNTADRMVFQLRQRHARGAYVGAAPSSLQHRCGHGLRGKVSAPLARAPLAQR